MGYAVTDGSMGSSTGRIWLDEVYCGELEDEPDFDDCEHAPWGVHDCSHFEDVGVICDGKLVCVCFW